MKVTIDGGGHITAHGDNLAGGGVISFPVNERPGFPTGWTVTGTAPNRVLLDPNGDHVAAEDVTEPVDTVAYVSLPPGDPQVGDTAVVASIDPVVMEWGSGGGGGSFPDFTGSGPPLGVVTADQGQSYYDSTNGALWLHTGGDADNTGWALAGGHWPDNPLGGNTLSIVAEPSQGLNIQTDGNYIELTADGGIMTFGSIAHRDVLDLWPNDGTRGVTGLVQALAGAGAESPVDPPFTAWSSWASNNASSGSFVVGAEGGIVIRTDDSSTDDPLVIHAPGDDATVLLKVTPTGDVVLPSLPTADPHVAGALWNSSGALHISAG